MWSEPADDDGTIVTGVLILDPCGCQIFMAVDRSEKYSIDLAPRAVRVDHARDDPGWTSDEVRWDEYSTGGPPSSSRLTHIPTGIVVTGEGGRSVMENRRRAEALLRARLAERRVEGDG